MKFDTVIRGGKIHTADATRTADIGIRGEQIAAIGKGLSTDGAQVIDARGKFVIPGGIDVHVHLQLDVGFTVSADDFRTGTMAAAQGGVTTVIDFADPDPNPETRHSLVRGIEARMAEAEGKVCVDYSLHGVLSKWKKMDHRDVARAVAMGVTSFKMFMVYEERGMRSDDADLFEALEAMREHDTCLCIHAESESVMNLLIARHRRRAWELGAWAHVLSRPNFIEAEAIQRAVRWSEETGGRLYVVHMSTGEGADIIRDAQGRGVPVHAETCPQYLVFDESVFRNRRRGHLWATCPQIKSKSDNARLWRGLRNGEVSVVSTDTCTFTKVQKERWGGDFTRIPYGLPGTETMIPCIYTHGVKRRRFSLNHMVGLVSTNPAKLFGLYPRKGTIAVGSDADIAIFDPKRGKRVDHRRMATNCDWSPYQGQTLFGFAETTLSRGSVIVKSGKFCGEPGHGQFVARRAGNLLKR